MGIDVQISSLQTLFNFARVSAASQPHVGVIITGYPQTTASTTMLIMRQSDQCGIGPDLSDWVGDGYCDDETNSENCNYDGGDCCWDKGLEI